MRYSTKYFELKDSLGRNISTKLINWRGRNKYIVIEINWKQIQLN